MCTFGMLQLTSSNQFSEELIKTSLIRALRIAFNQVWKTKFSYVHAYICTYFLLSSLADQHVIISIPFGLSTNVETALELCILRLVDQYKRERSFKIIYCEFRFLPKIPLVAIIDFFYSNPIYYRTNYTMEEDFWAISHLNYRSWN